MTDRIPVNQTNRESFVFILRTEYPSGGDLATPPLPIVPPLLRVGGFGWNSDWIGLRVVPRHASGKILALRREALFFEPLKTRPSHSIAPPADEHPPRR